MVLRTFEGVLKGLESAPGRVRLRFVEDMSDYTTSESSTGSKLHVITVKSFAYRAIIASHLHLHLQVDVILPRRTRPKVRSHLP